VDGVEVAGFCFVFGSPFYTIGMNEIVSKTAFHTPIQKKKLQGTVNNPTKRVHNK
jgi:hypothetical protein